MFVTVYHHRETDPVAVVISEPRTYGKGRGGVYTYYHFTDYQGNRLGVEVIDFTDRAWEELTYSWGSSLNLS